METAPARTTARPPLVDARPNLFGLDRPQLDAVVRSMGEPAYRARQLHAWMYRKRARTLAAMTDLPRGFRDRLAETHDLRWPQVQERNRSSDGTVKYLFRLDDGATIEAVYIPEERRRTICISTQAGCPLACAFCLTGISGYKRNLKPWEILGQVATVMEECQEPAASEARIHSAPSGRGGARSARGGAPEDVPPRAQEKPWNVVVMGMGEPLLNYDGTVPSLRLLMDKDAFAVAPRRLTLSTVGILPGLERLMLEPVRPNLAISLHAPNQELRRQLMPVDEKYPLALVIEAAERYPIPHGGRVTYEYVLLKGVNDAPEHARQLARLVKGSHAKVNLIPLNPTPEIPFERPTPEAVDRFAGILAAARVPVSVRRQRGQDILAACGQLHLKKGEALTRGIRPPRS
jgi:23S rRNA (adenine2503-C2)-methyltransferase